MRTKLSTCFLVSSAFALCIGCGGSTDRLAPVQGKVTIDGQPLPGGRVMFAPIAQGDTPEAGRPAFGDVQPDGTFTLGTFSDGDGAVVGEHWVTLYGQQIDATASSVSGMPKFRRYSVPQKQVVRAGDANHVEIKLSSAAIARLAAQ